MKNQRGVTLIALVVTIIVLIILAGVAIAALLDDNGVITRSRLAKRNQIEGEVRDTVSLAIQAAKMEAEHKSATSTDGFFAETDLVAASSTIKTLLEKELAPTAASAGADGYHVATGTTGSGDNQKTTVTITFTSNDYKQATNNDSATIVCKFLVDNNIFALDTTFGDNTTGWDYTPDIEG